MKKCIFIALCFLSMGCTELLFEDNQRLYIIGRIIDSTGKPISNISVGAYGIIDSSPPVGGVRQLLGFNCSDSSGNFSITAISPDNEDRLRILINTRDVNECRFSTRYTAIELDINDFRTNDNLEYKLTDPIILN